jgi:hypothetical protein
LFFAITANRAQSITLRQPCMVHIEPFMSFETCYVSISRCTTFADLWFNTTPMKVLHPEPYPIVSRFQSLPGPLDALIYRSSDEKAEYIGQTVINNGRMPHEQLNKRMYEHHSTRATPFEKRLTSAFKHTILHRALYKNIRDVVRDETAFIQRVTLEPLNVLQQAKKKTQKRQREISVPEIKDVRLGKITATASVKGAFRYAFKFPGRKRVRVTATKENVVEKFEEAALANGNFREMYTNGIKAYVESQVALIPGLPC